METRQHDQRAITTSPLSNATESNLPVIDHRSNFLVPHNTPVLQSLQKAWIVTTPRDQHQHVRTAKIVFTFRHRKPYTCLREFAHEGKDVLIAHMIRQILYF